MSKKFDVSHIAVKDLPAADLALANFSSPEILETQSLINNSALYIAKIE